MGYLLRLAWRNALRNRRRTMFTIVSLVLGIGLYVLGQSFVDGIERTLVSTEIDKESAHLRVMTKAWFEDEDFHPLDKPFPEAAAVATLLRETYPGATVLLRTTFAARIGDHARALPCRGMVVDPAEYKKMFQVGDFAEPEAGPTPYVWVGADLAKAFGFKPGDELVLDAKTRRGSRNAEDPVRIAGIVSSGHPIVDNFTVILPASFGERFIDIDSSFATEVMARFPDPDTADQADALVTERFPTLTAETWREKTQYLIDLNDIRRKNFNMVVFIILLIGASSVANTCLMSGFERTTEVGTLLALGYPRRSVRLLFIAESVLIGFAGAVAGTLVGGAISAWFTSHGLAFPEVQAQEGAMPMPPVLYFDLTAHVLVQGVLIGLFVAVIASLYPAFRASKLDPIVALREGG